MSYSKSIFFIPVWFNDFAQFTKELDKMPIWKIASYKKLWVKYLYNYASSLTKTERRNRAEPEETRTPAPAEPAKTKPAPGKNKIKTMGRRKEDVFAHYILRDVSSLDPYMYADVLQLKHTPKLEEVRFSCFATGVGFLEFWVSYQDMTAEEIAGFAYHFKKARGAGGAHRRKLPEGQKLLYNVASSLLPESIDARLFFAAADKVKSECNCFHYIHLDEAIPDEETRRSTLYRLSRSYLPTMPVAGGSEYDMIYEAGEGDYWCGSPEGLANIVYDYKDHKPGDPDDYYLHRLKPESMENDYYFMYLLLLNQKYAAVQYINTVSLSLERSFADVEDLSRRIVQLKNMFSFNVISDDSVVQNVYSKMYRIMEIKSLLDDVIDNEACR